jgi:hypothetical protein
MVESVTGTDQLEGAMASRLNRTVSLVSILTLTAALLGAPMFSSNSEAASTGTLKLKVWGCRASGWISNAAVGVVIIRPGSGQVDSDSGYTNSTGYVEFTFDSLEDGDEAHVTVTPSGGEADGSHVYHWIGPQGRTAGYWDLDTLIDSLCADDWYDQGAGIFKCAYPLWKSSE